MAVRHLIQAPYFFLLSAAFLKHRQIAAQSGRDPGIVRE
jgi:hypothetical protein